MAKKSKALVPLMTRIPEGLRVVLEKEAKRNGRSMNAEIIHRLSESLAAGTILDLYKGYAEMAANAAAEKVSKRTADEVVERIRRLRPGRGLLGEQVYEEPPITTDKKD
jgi:hypothetical protein